MQSRPIVSSLTEADTAQYIGMSVAYLRKARRLGVGPAYLHIGRSIRYKLDDLDQWLSQRRVETSDSRKQAVGR